MDVLEAILIILALKIPIVGLLFWVYTLMKDPAEDPEPETVRSKMPPRLPEPGDGGPRRRGPHGGAAAAPPSPRRDPHPAPAIGPREAPVLRERSTRP
jgi:hypothetical protein